MTDLMMVVQCVYSSWLSHLLMMILLIVAVMEAYSSRIPLLTEGVCVFYSFLQYWWLPLILRIRRRRWRYSDTWYSTPHDDDIVLMGSIVMMTLLPLLMINDDILMMIFWYYPNYWRLSVMILMMMTDETLLMVLAYVVSSDDSIPMILIPSQYSWYYSANLFLFMALKMIPICSFLGHWLLLFDITEGYSTHWPGGTWYWWWWYYWLKPSLHSFDLIISDDDEARIY